MHMTINDKSNTNSIDIFNHDVKRANYKFKFERNKSLYGNSNNTKKSSASRQSSNAGANST